MPCHVSHDSIAVYSSSGGADGHLYVHQPGPARHEKDGSVMMGIICMTCSRLGHKTVLFCSTWMYNMQITTMSDEW